MKIFVYNSKTTNSPGMIVLGSMILLATCAVSVAADVVVVISNGAMPYQIAQWALKKELINQKISVRVARLENHQDSIENLLKENPKVFVGVGTEAAVWLHKSVSDPAKVKYCMVSDPETAGLNQDPPIEGLSVDAPLSMQFQLIAETLPEAHTLGMLYRSDTEYGQNLLKQVKAQLPENFKLEAVAVDTYPSLSKAIDDLFSRSISVVWTYPEASIFNRTSVQKLLLSSRRSGVPVFGYSLGFVKAGALVGVTIDPELQGKHTAEIIAEKVKTGKCSFTDEDVIGTCEIALNEFTAKQLKRTIPESVKKRAKHTFSSKKD